MRRRRHFSDREFNIDPADLVESINDIIEAVMDAGMDSVHAMGDRTTWKADNLRHEAKAFAARFSAHPGWHSAKERATRARGEAHTSSDSRGWSDTD